MPRTLPVRARMGVGVAAMVLPLLAVSGTAVLGLEATLESFADTADEAIEEALPLARLQTLVVQVERDAEHAALHPEEAGPELYLATRDRLVAAFAALDGQDMTEEGDLVAVAERRALRAVDVLDEVVAAPATSPAERTAVLDRLDEARGHVQEAATALGRAEALASSDILDEYDAAHEGQGQVLAGILAVVAAGLAVALAGGLHLTRAVLGPLGASGRPPTGSGTACCPTACRWTARTSSARWHGRSTPWPRGWNASSRRSPAPPARTR